MARHFWYKGEWMERHERDLDPKLKVWTPNVVDIIAPSRKEAEYLLKSCHIPKGVEYQFVSVTKYGDEQDYLENQGQLELEFNAVDPFKSV